MVNEFAISEEEGFTRWYVLGMLHAEGVTNYTGGVAEKWKGDCKLIREGFLRGDGVHRNAGDLNLVI